MFNTFKFSFITSTQELICFYICIYAIIISCEYLYSVIRNKNNLKDSSFK